MPFKTKAQKIAASQRRFSVSSQGKVSYINSSEDKASKEENSSILKVKKAPLREVGSIEDLGYLKVDIFKIAIATSVIVAFELALSLTLR